MINKQVYITPMIIYFVVIKLKCKVFCDTIIAQYLYIVYFNYIKN